MAYRLALEAPRRFRAVAGVSASYPTADNTKCHPVARGTAPILIMNGTADPLNPYAGGEVALYGLFMHRGTVLSSASTARLFAGLNGIPDHPETQETRWPDGDAMEQATWRGNGRMVELVTIPGGGHALPQPWRRGPRLLGPTHVNPNGPDLIWQFFSQQEPMKR